MIRSAGQGTRQRASSRPCALGVRRALMIVCMLPLLLAGSPAFGADIDDEYDATDAGHPLRVVAYILHPVGVILDTLIFRPAHWLGTKEPIKTLVGNED